MSDPYVDAVIARREAGEPSVYAYQCGFSCGWLWERGDGRCPCTENESLRATRGYWGHSDEAPEGDYAWFYPLDSVRQAMAEAIVRGKT